MSRNPDNAKIWADARVFLSDADIRPALPADISTAISDTLWPEVGILDGDKGFSEERKADEKEHYGWGIGLIKIGTKNFKLSRKFSPLEDNSQVRGLVWPRSTATKLLMPKPVYRWIGFENVSDQGEKERLFSTRRARIWVPSNNRNESDITAWEVEASLFANGSDELFDRQASLTLSSFTVTFAGGPFTAGSLTLGVDGSTASGVAYNATSSAIKTALEALPSVGTGNATVTGTIAGGLTITVPGLLTASGSGLTPSGTATVTRV